MEIYIQRDMPFNTVSVFVKQKRGSHDVFYHYDGKDVIATTVEQEQVINNDIEIKPFISMPFSIYNLFAKSFIDEVKKEGITSESDATIKGKMDAMKVHLDDLRASNDKLLDAVVNVLKKTNL